MGFTLKISLLAIVSVVMGGSIIVSRMLRQMRFKKFIANINSGKTDPSDVASHLKGYIASRPMHLCAEKNILLQKLNALNEHRFGRFSVLLLKFYEIHSCLLIVKENTQEFIPSTSHFQITTALNNTKFYRLRFFPDQQAGQYIINGDLDVSRYDEQIQKELAELIFDRLAAGTKQHR